MRRGFVYLVMAWCLGGIVTESAARSEVRHTAVDAPVESRTFNAALLEQGIFDAVNRVRVRHGLRPLAPDQGLARAARAHSADMGARGFFSHDTPRSFMRKVSFGDRLRTQGVQIPSLAENIAMLPLVRSRRVTTQYDEQGHRVRQVEENRSSYSELAKWAVQQWMDSPGHRKNILNPHLTRMGMGAALGVRKGEEYVYLTQDFGG